MATIGALFRIQLCCHVSFDGMKECCDVLYHNYVDPASIYRILPQIWPDPSRIQIHWIRLDQIRPGSTKFTGYLAGSGSGSGAPLHLFAVAP